LGEDHPSVASTLITIGKLQPKDRRRYLNEAFSILEKYIPKDYSCTIQCLKELSEIETKEKKYMDGIRYQIHSRDNPKTTKTLQKIGDIYFDDLHDYSSAYDYYSESSDISFESVNDMHIHQTNIHHPESQLCLLL